MEFWKTDIANIEFDLQSRDEIPKLLMGLQYIHRTRSIREKVSEVLKQIVVPFRQACMNRNKKNDTIGYPTIQRRIADGIEKLPNPTT